MTILMAVASGCASAKILVKRVTGLQAGIASCRRTLTNKVNLLITTYLLIKVQLPFGLTLFLDTMSSFLALDAESRRANGFRGT